MSLPQFGEYATPEEQRRAAGLPPTAPEPAVLHPAAPPPAAPVAARRPADRLVTLVLLGFGLVNVLMSVPGFLDLATAMNRTLEMLGIDGEFTNFGPARTWGVVAAIVLVLGYAATAWLAWRRLRAGRTSWWIPLVGFVVTMFLVSMCIMVPMLGDPAFTQGMLATAP